MPVLIITLVILFAISWKIALLGLPFLFLRRGNPPPAERKGRTKKPVNVPMPTRSKTWRF